MARTRTQKVVSKRIDLSYIKRPTPLRTGRKLLAFVAGAIAIAGVTFLSLGGDSKLHNPGQLTNSHAAWQNNCNVCHTGTDATGQPAPGVFAKTVSDAACLQCHDGALHHPNQPLATIGSFGTSATDTVIGKPIIAAHMVAKDCVSCHTEHRGHELLMASDSRLCIDCHDDLAKHSQKSPAASNHATAFTKADHPSFGRRLVVDAKLTDPTVLKYNHAKHNTMAPLAENCIACHNVNNFDVPVSRPSATTPPPYALESDAVVGGRAMAHIEQISFDRHCIGCHAIELPGSPGIAIPHRPLEEVRAFLAGVGNNYATRLAAMSPAERQKELVVTIPAKPPRKASTKTITESEWIDTRLKELSDNMDKSFGSSNARYTLLKKTVKSPTTQPAGIAGGAVSQGPDVNLLEHFVTTAIKANCVLCHTVQGDVPAIAYKPAGAATTATTEAKPTVLAFTVPTGIPATPRHWFVGANFDHRSHRSVNCLDCHASARFSSATSDVNSPMIDTASASGVSCLTCHSPNLPNSAGGAGSDCTTCHSFHDRSMERSSPGAFNLGFKSAPLPLPDTLAATRPAVPGK